MLKFNTIIEGRKDYLLPKPDAEVCINRPTILKSLLLKTLTAYYY